MRVRVLTPMRPCYAFAQSEGCIRRELARGQIQRARPYLRFVSRLQAVCYLCGGRETCAEMTLRLPVRKVRPELV